MSALRTPGAVTPLPALRAPLPFFPKLAVPKLQPAPAVPSLEALTRKLKAAQPTSTRKSVTRRVPVVADAYTLVPPGELQGGATKAPPFAASSTVAAAAAAVTGAAVVGSSVGAPYGNTPQTPAPGTPATVEDTIGGVPSSLAAGNSTPAAGTAPTVVDTVGNPPAGALQDATTTTPSGQAAAPTTTTPSAAAAAATTTATPGDTATAATTATTPGAAAAAATTPSTDAPAGQSGSDPGLTPGSAAATPPADGAAAPATRDEHTTVTAWNDTAAPADDTTTPPADDTTPPADDTTISSEPITPPAVDDISAPPTTDVTAPTTSGDVSAPDTTTTDTTTTTGDESDPVPPTISVDAPDTTTTVTVTTPASNPGDGLDTTVTTPDDAAAGTIAAAPGDDGSDGTATDAPGDTLTAACATGGSATSPTPTDGGSAGGTDETACSDDSTTIPDGADVPPADPAATPGSGPSPPAEWAVDATGESSTVAISGGDIVVTAGGVISSRAAADVTTLTISGGSALALDLSGGDLGVALVFLAAADGSLTVGPGAGSDWSWDGGAGTVSGGGIASLRFANVTHLTAGGADDTLHGPAADSVWTIDGAGAGTVGGLAFSGFENLAGAAGNKDEFVVDATGSVAGVVDGGAGGYDTLVIGGGTYENVTYVATDPSSGSVDRDGNVITYTGLEPVADSGNTSSTKTYTGTGGDDQIVIADTGTANDGGFQITANTSESIQISGAADIQSLTIDAGDGNDSIEIQSIDSLFTGTIHLIGGSGTNTLIGSAGGVFDVTGIGSGVYTPNGGPRVEFDGMQNLAGGPGGTGSVDVTLGTFVHFGATSVSFGAPTTVGAKLSDGSSVNDLTMATLGLSGVSVFVGSGYGTDDAAGFTGTVDQLGAAFVADTAGGRFWTALHATSGTVTVDYNSSWDGVSVDFTHLDLANGTTYGTNGLAVGGVTLNDAVPTLSASATHVSASVGGLLSGSADFSVSRQAIANAEVSGGTPSTLGADLVTLTLTNLTLVAGRDGFGASIGGDGATLTLAELAPSDSSSDSRVWWATKATGLTVTLDVPGLSGTVTGGSVSVNGASGADANGVAATALTDWGAATGGASPAGFTFTGAVTAVAGTIDTVSFAGVLTGSIGFAISVQSLDVDLPGDATASAAKLLTVTLTDADLKLGADDFGATVGGGPFTFVALAPTAGADTRSWYAAVGSGLTVTATLPGITGTITAGGLRVNQA
ncbi:MAG TPA: hypothetical protein VF186_02090, partial [Gaiellaceae bacterium]